MKREQRHAATQGGLPFFIWVAGAARISCTWPPSYIEGEFKFFQQAIDQVLSKNDKKKSVYYG
jgi:hypothetical protein